MRADLLKLQGEEGVLATELKQVLTCLQQYYVENEVLKKGVLQLGGDEVLTKLLTSSKDVTDQLYTTKPKSKDSRTCKGNGERCKQVVQTMIKCQTM